MSVFLEIPLLARSIDMVIDDGEHLVTIEFKLRDWRRGIRQVQDHQMGADRCYLCIPEGDATNAVACALRLEGIGLYVFRQDATHPLVELISPVAETPFWRPARQWLRQAIDERRANPLPRRLLHV